MSLVGLMLTFREEEGEGEGEVEECAGGDLDWMEEGAGEDLD